MHFVNIERKSMRKELNQFAVPLVMKNSFQLVIEFGLAVMTGHISLAAIAVTGTIDGLVYTIIGFLGSGTISYTIYASRIREKDSREARELFKSLLLLNSLLGVSGTVLLLAFAEVLMSRLYQYDGALLRLACSYCRVSSWNVVLTVIGFALTNQLKVRKQTKGILHAGLFSGVCQLILTLLFAELVFTGESRVLGIALASMLSECLVVGYYVWLLRKDFLSLKGISASRWTFLLRKSSLLFLQELLEGSLFQVLITAALARMGNLIFSAYQVCLTLTNLFLSPMFMYCNGLLVLLGEKIGLGEIKRIHSLPIVTLQILLTIFVGLAAPAWLLRQQLLQLITDIPEVSQLAVRIFGSVILVESTRLFYEIAKYSLQSTGAEGQALAITSLSNGAAWLFIMLLPNQFSVILFIVSASNLFSAVAFYHHYLKRCKSITTCSRILKG